MSLPLFRVGIDLPEIEVRFEHLTIDAEAYVGSRALPSFINSAFNQIEVAKMQIQITSQAINILLGKFVFRL